MSNQFKRRFSRQRKAIRRRLQFERCEERALLAATPISDLIQLTEVDPNSIPANIVVSEQQVAAHTTNDTNNNNSASTNDPADQANTNFANTPIANALQSVDPGEGGFESLHLNIVEYDSNAVILGGSAAVYGNDSGYRLQFTDSASLRFGSDAFADRAVNATDLDSAATIVENNSVTLGSVVIGRPAHANGVRSTREFDFLVSANSDFPTTKTKPFDENSRELFRTNIDGYRNSEIEFDEHTERSSIRISRLLSGESLEFRSVLPQQVTGQIDSSDPPASSVLTIGQIETVPKHESHRTNNAIGEGEFVRLTVGTYDEQVAIAQAIKSKGLRAGEAHVVASTRPVVPQVTSHSSVKSAKSFRVASPNNASAAWQLELVPVSRIATAFDASDIVIVPTVGQQVDGDTNLDTGEFIHSDTPPASATQPADHAILPNADTVSSNATQRIETGADSSTTYLSVSPLAVAVAGAILVKDRWQKLQPERKKRKPR